MKFLAVLFAGAVALMLPVEAAKSEVVWTFTETFCTSENGGCQDLHLPFAVAQLSLPDINSSGHYIYESDGIRPPIETGDTDFFFIWGIPADIFSSSAPVLKGGPGRPGCHLNVFCIWDIEFASSEASPKISVFFTGPPLNSSNISFGGDGGSIGADGIMPGCGSFAQCSIGGFWTLTSVPEPSSISILASGLIIIFPFVSRWKVHPRRRLLAATARGGAYARWQGLAHPLRLDLVEDALEGPDAGR